MTLPLSTEEALSCILSAVSVLPAENIPVRKSLGRVLAENLGADIHINVWEWWPLILIFIGMANSPLS